MTNRIRGVHALLPLLVFCLVLPRGAAAQQCEHGADRTATGSLAGVERVHIIAGSGSLEVTGRAGASDMSARGRACTSRAGDLAALRLEARRDGSTLVLEAHYPNRHVRMGDYYARIDLAVDVPQGMAVSIDDGSGDLTVSAVGAARITDGSGNLHVRDVRGSLHVNDGSGNIDIAAVSGSVEIDDGSGNIEIADVRGDVAIDDGSGDVRVREVGGSVRIEDGSGDIRVVDVVRSVLVDEDGSGSIRVERIGGNFTVDDDGSGGVSYSNVTGRVSIPDDD